MDLAKLNSTQKKLLQLLDDETIYVITRDNQAMDSTSNGFAVGTYGTEFKLVVWFITEHLNPVDDYDKVNKNDLIDCLLTAQDKIDYLSKLFGLTIVKGYKAL